MQLSRKDDDWTHNNLLPGMTLSLSSLSALTALLCGEISSFFGVLQEEPDDFFRKSPMTAVFFFSSPETEPTSAGPGFLPFLFLFAHKIARRDNLL